LAAVLGGCGAVFRVGILGAILMACAAGGCRPVSENGREYYSAREKAQRQKEKLQEVLETDRSEAAAIELVRESRAPDGQGTVEDWIKRRQEQEGGRVLFPHWEARPRGRDRYEVRYTYTVAGEDYSIVKKVLAWNADMVLKLVGGVREIQPAGPGNNARGAALRGSAAGGRDR